MNAIERRKTLWSQHLYARTFGSNTSAREADHVLGKLRHEVQIMKRDHRDHVLTANGFLNGVQNDKLMSHVERSGGFVQQQNLGAAEHGLCQKHHLPLSSADLIQRPACKMGNSETGQRGFNLVLQGLRHGEAKAAHTAQENHFEHADTALRAAVLRHIGKDFSPLGRILNIAVQGDGSGGRQKTGNCLEQGRFSGAVGADQGSDLPRFNPGANIGQDRFAPVAGIKGLDRKANQLFLLPRRIRMNRKGTPKTAVTMPIGMT